MRKKVFSVMPECEPEKKAVYSDITFLTLGFLLEEVLQAPLDHAVERYLWKPMGIRSSFYRRVDRSPAKARLENVVPTEDSEWRGGILQGQVHDDNCWAMGGYGGHTGVFAPICDVFTWVRALFDGFISSGILRESWSRVNRPAGCERTLGWDSPSGSASSAGKYFSSNAVGHLGFTGTSIWIEPKAGFAVCLLSNRVFPSRENIKIRELRPRFHNLLIEELSR